MIGILAMGIAASAAVFSVINAVLLHPLPYRDPGHIVVAGEARVQEGTLRNAVTAADYLDWRARNHVFYLDANDQMELNLTGSGAPERVIATLATTGMFSLYGIQPIAGRPFAQADVLGNGRIALLSHQFWQRHYTAQASAVGRWLILDDAPYEILGVLPPGFRIYFGRPTDIFLPLALTPAERVDRGSHRFLVQARLRPGVSITKAQTEMNTITRQLAVEYPAEDVGHTTRLVPLSNELTENFRPALLLLWTAVSFLVLLVCANLANLMLARSTVREREFAIRHALGASWARLMSYVLSESLLLAACGGILGSIGAYAALGVLTFLPRTPQFANIPGLSAASIDGRVLAFALSLALLTGIIFGLAPALQLSRPNPIESLRAATRSSSIGKRTHGLRSGLVIAEVSLACMLMIGSVLLLRSFLHLLRTDPGFQSSNRYAVELSLPESRYRSLGKQGTFYQTRLDRTSALPFVSSAAITTLTPGSTWGPRWGLLFENHPRPRTMEEWPKSSWRIVSDTFFSTMRIPLLEGRAFNSSDRPDSPKVVILSEATVRKYFGRTNPLGTRIAMAHDPARRTVIGIAGSVHYLGSIKLRSQSSIFQSRNIRFQVLLSHLWLKHAAARWQTSRACSLPSILCCRLAKRNRLLVSSTTLSANSVSRLFSWPLSHYSDSCLPQPGAIASRPMSSHTAIAKSAFALPSVHNAEISSPWCCARHAFSRSPGLPLVSLHR